MRLFLLIGTYTEDTSRGIYVYEFDQEEGDAKYNSQIQVENPSYLVVNATATSVYAVTENEKAQDSFVSAFEFDSARGTLSFLNAQKVFGGAPCYINIGRENKNIVTANYLGGNISVFNTAADGSLCELQQLFTYKGQGVHPDRQQQAHLHSVVFSPDYEYLFACDLGLDCIYSFKVNYNNEKPFLEEGNPSFVQVEAGSGPRHLVFHQNKKYAYVICELSGKVIVFAYNDGRLTEIQHVVSDYNRAEGSADIHIHPNGKFLYTSNRLEEDGIAIFKIDIHTGRLEKVGYKKTALHPRNFCITPNGKFMLVANLESNIIQILSINAHSGQLTLHQNSIKIDSPVCVKFTR